MSTGRSRPRVGITAAAGGSATPKGQLYAAAVASAGGEPVWLEPPAVLAAKDDPGRILDRLDALLLPGGVDIHPRHYGESVLPDAGIEIDPERDAAELLITRAALAAEVPILGICRGIQTLNVAAGGSLHQDLGLLGLDPTVHMQGTQRPPWEPAHPVAAAEDSRVSSLLDGRRSEVNSFHHQAVKDVAPGFVVTARAPDGVIETIENPHRPFVLGVQWHPEMMVDHHARQRKLFDALIEAARARP